MSLNITELVENERIDVTAEVVLDSGQGALRSKYMGAIMHALGRYNTKTVALKKLYSQLEDEGYPEMNEICHKLFVMVNKIYAKSEEPMLNRIYAGKCLVQIVKAAAASSELQREMTSHISGLLNTLINIDAPEAWVELLTQLMILYPGPCGPSRGHITKKLCAEVGEGRLHKSDLGKLFTLTAQIGGGGKEGVDHIKGFSTLFYKVADTANTIFNQLFSDVQTFQRFATVGDILQISNKGIDSVANQSLRIQQVLDLVDIECGMLTCRFNQPREIDCELILRQISGLLSITSADLVQNDIPKNMLMNLMLPSLQAKAAQLLQALILSVEEDLIPEVATINNIFIKSLQTAKSPMVIESLFKVLMVYTDILGACSGLQFCMDRIIPVFAQHIVPKQEKILLLGHQRRNKGGKKKKGKQIIDEYKNVNSPAQNQVNPKVLRSALSCLGTIMEGIGCLFSDEDYLSITSLLVNTAVKRQIEDIPAIVSLIENLGILSRIPNPSFPNPLRLCLHFLHQSTNHTNQDVSRAAKSTLSLLSTVLHPACPTLAIPVLQEDDMKNILKKILRVQIDREEEDVESDEETSMDTQQNDVSGSKFVEEIPSKSSKESSHSKSTDNSTPASVGTQLKRKIDIAADNSSDEDNAELEDNIKQIEKVKRQRKASERIAASLQTENAGKEQQSAVESQNKVENKDKKAGIDVKSAVNGDKKAGKDIQAADSSNKSASVSKTTKDSVKPTAKKDYQASTAAKKDNATDAKTDDKNKTNSEGTDLDVESMLNDFSDKLNENLLPDPFDSD